MTSHQAPVGSPFTASSTVEEVLDGIDLTGKSVIVTGGYSGIGLQAVRAMLDAGAKVTVPTRSIEKANAALAGLAGVTVDHMNLMDPDSIDGFARRFIAREGKLDILINCAGIMAAPLTRDGRGYESQFSTNVLGHFLLSCRLWPALKTSGNARVVAVTSNNHLTNISALLHDPNFDQSEYSPWLAYANSKAANILFAVALDQIGKSQGVRAFAAHPGGIFETGLIRHMDDLTIAKQAGMIDDEGIPIIDPENGWKTPAQGAATMVWAATSPLLEGIGGVYCTNSEVGVQLDAIPQGLSLTGVAPNVTDPVNAGRLWALCEQLTGAQID